MGGGGGGCEGNECFTSLTTCTRDDNEMLPSIRLASLADIVFKISSPELLSPPPHVGAVGVRVMITRRDN
jgi:hypothetical protein